MLKHFRERLKQLPGQIQVQFDLLRFIIPNGVKLLEGLRDWANCVQHQCLNPRQRPVRLLGALQAQVSVNLVQTGGTSDRYVGEDELTQQASLCIVSHRVKARRDVRSVV